MLERKWEGKQSSRWENYWNKYGHKWKQGDSQALQLPILMKIITYFAWNNSSFSQFLSPLYLANSTQATSHLCAPTGNLGQKLFLLLQNCRYNLIQTYHLKVPAGDCKTTQPLFSNKLLYPNTLKSWGSRDSKSSSCAAMQTEFLLDLYLKTG